VPAAAIVTYPGDPDIARVFQAARAAELVCDIGPRALTSPDVGLAFLDVGLELALVPHDHERRCFSAIAAGL
jgi:hypothetical protein